MQSMIGNVPLGSIFAFLQSYGAGGWAATAVNSGEFTLLVAYLLTAIGTLLRDRGMAEEKGFEATEEVWCSMTGTQPDMIHMKDEL